MTDGSAVSGATYSYKIRAYYRSWGIPYVYGYSGWSDCVEIKLGDSGNDDECIKFIVDNQQECDLLPDYFKNLSSPKDGHVFFVAELTMEEIKCGYIFHSSIMENVILLDSEGKIYPLIDFLIKGIQYEENDFSSNTASLSTNST